VLAAFQELETGRKWGLIRVSKLERFKGHHPVDSHLYFELKFDRVVDDLPKETACLSNIMFKLQFDALVVEL
jgi:hypothetical protein